MPLGILEPRTTPGHHVPGTVLLDLQDSSAERNLELEYAGLKKGSGKNSEVILVPQPSSDPNDPLNWPIWQRDLILLLYCYCTLCCVGGAGPILSSMAIPLIKEFHIDFSQVSLLTGYQLCTVGAVGVVVSACARKYGRRPTLLWSISCAFAGTVWGGFAESYDSLIGARVVQGLGVAMFESVTFSLIGDLYHVHQRGTRMTLYIVSQSGLAQLPTTVAGKITSDLGWRWVFHLLSIFIGIGWFLCLFFGWETLFIRNSIYNLDTSSHDRIAEVKETKGVHVQEMENVQQISTDGAQSRASVFHRMLLFHGTFTDEPLWMLIVRPFYVIVNPTILWALVIIAFTSTWIVLISFTIAQAFYGPPYYLTIPQQGYISAGPLVGGFLGCIACGLICDPMARYLTRKNKGVYEPEFRLPMMIFVPIVSTIGYFLFGNLIQQGQSPVGASVMFGLVFVSVQFTAVSTGAYIVDSFRDISVEIFIISMTTKNFIFYGFTYFLNEWYAAVGPAVMFDTIGGIQLGLSLTTIPIYIFGKRLRAWWHAHNILGAKGKSEI